MAKKRQASRTATPATRRGRRPPRQQPAADVPLTQAAVDRHPVEMTANAPPGVVADLQRQFQAGSQKVTPPRMPLPDGIKKQIHQIVQQAQSRIERLMPDHSTSEEVVVLDSYKLANSLALAVACLRDTITADPSRSDAERDQARDRVIEMLETGNPVSGDPRTPLVLDGWPVALCDPDEDPRTRHITLRLPAVVIERLRDAVALMQPGMTMAGLVSAAVLGSLANIEMSLLLQTRKGIPKRPTEVLAGGRPSRLRKPVGRRRPPDNAHS